MDRSINENALV